MPVRNPIRLRANELAEPSPLAPPETDVSGIHAVEDVLGEIGLVLAMVLGIALAVNAVLISLQIVP